MKKEQLNMMSTHDLLVRMKASKFAVIFVLGVCSVILVGGLTIAWEAIIMDFGTYFSVFMVFALFFGCLLVPVIKDIKNIKEILKERGYSEAEDKNAKASAKKTLTIVIALIIAFLAIAFAIVLSTNGNGGSASSKPWEDLGVSEREYMQIYNKYKYGE